MNIPITKTIFDENDFTAIQEPLKSGWVVQGPKVHEFEAAFKKFTNAPYAEALSNCTTALHLGLLALGIGAGDKVIVPAFTYVASANAVEYTEASVIFCDIELSSFNLELNQLESILKTHHNVKAIMPVHLFGLCANMPEILKLANYYGVRIIEDAACALGSTIDGQHAGTFGDVGCFSFHPRKVITTGEGGMLITPHELLAKRVNQLKDHGASKSDFARHQDQKGSLLPDFNVRGYNYRMTDFQGALGVSQMQKLSHILQSRVAIAEKYHQTLNHVTHLSLPQSPTNYHHAYQSYVTLLLDKNPFSHLSIKKINLLNEKRNKLMQQLAEVGIATRQGTHALHTLSYYKNRYHLNDEDYLNAYAADRLSMTLPLYANMSSVEFDYIIHHLSETLTICAAYAV